MSEVVIALKRSEKGNTIAGGKTLGGFALRAALIRYSTLLFSSLVYDHFGLGLSFYLSWRARVLLYLFSDWLLLRIS